MNDEGIFKRLKELLTAEFGVAEDIVGAEKLLYDDLGLDSLDAVDLLVALKDNLNGKIDPALFKNAKTVQDLADMLHPLWKN